MSFLALIYTKEKSHIDFSFEHYYYTNHYPILTNLTKTIEENPF